jgi:hypothetical protein
MDESDRQWFQVALAGSGSLALLVFLEETNFVRRPEFQEIDLHAEDIDNERVPHSADRQHNDQVEDGDDKDARPAVRVVETITYAPTPWPGVAIRHLVKRSEHPWGIVWRGFAQPFAMLQLPIILWCGLIFGVYQVYFNRKCPIPSRMLTCQSSALTWLPS